MLTLLTFVSISTTILLCQHFQLALPGSANDNNSFLSASAASSDVASSFDHKMSKKSRQKVRARALIEMLPFLIVVVLTAILPLLSPLLVFVPLLLLLILLQHWAL